MKKRIEIMKKHSITRILLSIGTASMIASCHGDLDIAQTDKFNSTNMWTEASDVTSATNGIYYRLRTAFGDNYADPFFWGELRVGPYMWGKGTNRSLANNDMLNVLLNTLSATTQSTDWKALYTTVDQCNQVIKYAPTVDMAEAERNRCLGNAHFIRAYVYFWIARTWGDAPVITAPTEGTGASIYPSRNPVAEVYALIESDIADALKYIDSNKAGCYYATTDNIHLLKAEFALWMHATAEGGGESLEQAETALTAIEKPVLLDDFAEVFRFGNKKNAEIAFAIHQANGESTLTSCYAHFIWGSTQIKSELQNKPNGVPVASNQWLLYSDEFIAFLKASKEQGDQRTDVTYQERTDASDMYPIIQWPAKIIGNNASGTMVWEQDIILYRYAYYYTLLAELRYFQGRYADALDVLNTLCKRAYGKADFYTDPTPAAVRQALIDENFKEFAEEGNIYFTLIRLGAIEEYNGYRYVEGLGQCGINPQQPNALLMPVSRSAMNKNNNIKQTEGWF